MKSGTARSEALRAGGPPLDSGRDREGIVREVETPTADGQRVRVEERSGERWQVDCLGEPLAVGDRIAFAPLPTGGDEGRSRPPSHAGERVGEMVRLLAARRTEWVCTLHESGGRLSLVPFGGIDAPELTLARRDAKQAQPGDRVVVVPLADKRGRGGKAGAPPTRGRGRTRPVRVREVLGPAGTPDPDHRALVWKHRLPRAFPRRTRLESETIDEAMPRSEIARRLDLRHLPFITIDPASARDHDDAVFAEERPSERLEVVSQDGGRSAPPKRPSWTRRLWVAIADVSHYVAEGSMLDSEARRRGNSFYFPDRAIPMLPERLSSGVCSLRPDVDRLAMVVELRLTAEGAVADALFHEAVIRSHARLAYEDAAHWLATAGAGSSESDAEAKEPLWGASLRCLDRIAHDLLRRRGEAGAILLELPELAIEVDDEGRPVDCAVRERNRAHELIEEAMLAANRAVASALDAAERPTIHRIHLPPPPAKLAALSTLLERLGVAEGAELERLEEPRVLAGILERVKGTEAEERVHTAALRSMSQARYALEPRGHFALRFEHYLHFTSPIRRYADLEVHRSLKRLVRDVPDSQRERSQRDRSERSARLAIWLSGRERLAVDVERDAAALACCALLRGREGERFTARVTAASEFGLFVRLDSPAASGLVPLRTMTGEWLHDPEQEVLIGPRSGARLGLGDAIVVRLLEVDLDRGRLAFRLEPGARSGEADATRTGRGRPERRPPAAPSRSR